MSSATTTSSASRSHFERASAPRDEETTKVVDQILRDRFTCRYFQPKEVSTDMITEIIDVAKNTPSGNNMQPWTKVYVVSPTLIPIMAVDLKAAHFNKVNKDTLHRPEYFHYPRGAYPDEYTARKRESGRLIASGLGIDRRDEEARDMYTSRNHDFFGAPLGLIFTSHRGMEQGIWLDVGYFLQNISIAARARGLETCSQGSFARYHTVLRKHLPIKDEEIVVCGMSIGYPGLEKIKELSVEQPKRSNEDIIEFCGF